VATLTVSLKRAVVDILVAVAARRERDPVIFRESLSLFGQRAVALRARHFLVQPGKCEFGGRMFEAGRGLPGLEGVAAGAVRPELSAMLIGVAGAALRGESQVGMAQPLHSNVFSFGRQDVPRVVTAFTGHFRVLALQHIARLAMVKIVARGFPFHDVEFRPEVFGVATGAILISGRVLGNSGMEALAGSNSLRNLAVTIGALEFARTQPEAVTRSALGRPLQAGVSPGKRTGGDLRDRAHGSAAQRCQS